MFSRFVNSPGLSRRSLLRAATAAGIAVAAGHGTMPRSARAADNGAKPRVGGEAHAMPTLVDGLALTPLGDQLAWFLDAVNAGGSGPTDADIAAHVAPSLLAAVPPAQLIGLMQGLAGGYGALTLQGVTRPPTATQAVGLVAAAVGIQLAMPITVEAVAPHRITNIFVYPSPSADGTALVPIAIDPEEATDAHLVDIGELGLYRAAVGSGGPTVVLEAGLTDSAATWSGIIPALASFTRVVSYDRPNTTAGASDPATMPRTATDVVADLHSLLVADDVPGPYVLVGHSVGGIFARLFAHRYPDEVAGLVLIDSSHEEQEVRRQDMVTADLFATEQWAVGANTEGIDLHTSFDQMRSARAASPLPWMPLIVLSAGQNDPAFFPAGWPMDSEEVLHNDLQADLAGLVAGGRHVVAERSGHYVQQSQPDLVVAAIRDVVQEAHNPKSWIVTAN